MKTERFELAINSAIIITISILLTFGCSSTLKNDQVVPAAIQENLKTQEPVLVRTSENVSRSVWTINTFGGDAGKIYFSGGFLNGSDFPVSVRCANAEALKTAIQSISQIIRGEFSSYVQGSNTDTGGIERYVEDGIAIFNKNIHVSGLKQKKVYWEEMLSPAAMQSTFNVWVMLEMDKGDYLRAKADVLRQLRDEFDKKGQVEAKAKAEKLLDDLKNEVKEEREGEVSDT